MNRNTHPSGRSDETRCTVCNHPECESLDRDVTLGVRTQAEVARVVGTHPSTVSRHRRNHALPRMAMAVAVDTSEIASGSLVHEHDRLYGLELVALERALAANDLRLARDMFAEIRKLLVVITDLQKAIAKGTLSDALAQQIGAQPDREAVRATFQAKLDALRDSDLRAPKVLEMIDALTSGASQEEIDRLAREAAESPKPPPDSVQDN
jgi:hypothetical protein